MNPERDYNPELTHRLQQILDQNKDKRIVVVGTTCTGKSTFLHHIRGSHDMDDLVYPQLTKEEADYVDQTPWTPEIGQTMTNLVREKVKIKPGEPVFGTVVIDSDLVIYLKISDELLKQRIITRKVNFEDAKNMQQQITQEITNSKIPVIEFPVG